LRNSPFRLAAVAFILALATGPAVHAAGSAGVRTTSGAGGGQIPGPILGFGVGALLPEGAFAQFNDPSYFIQSRSLYVEKVIGGRAAAYYGDTSGTNGQGGGHILGFDFDFLVKFGSASTFGYVYAGAGYGSLTYSAPGPIPGVAVHHSGYDWCWTGGIGVTIKRKFYMEASYVSYQTGPDATEFVPVVIGFQF
jgi:hypothetical protein